MLVFFLYWKRFFYIVFCAEVLVNLLSSIKSQFTYIVKLFILLLLPFLMHIHAIKLM